MNKIIQSLSEVEKSRMKIESDFFENISRIISKLIDSIKSFFDKF